MPLSTTRRAVGVALLLCTSAVAQDVRPLLDVATAIERGDALSPVLPDAQWIPGTRWLAVVVTRDGVEHVEARAPDGTVVELFDAGGAKQALAEGGVDDADGKTLPKFRFVDRERIAFDRDDGVVHWAFAGPRAERVLAWPRDVHAAAIAPNDELAAVVAPDHQLEIRNDHGGIRRLTEDGSADVRYGQSAHRSEFGIRDGLWWDPEGRRLAFSREDLRGVEPYPFVDTRTLPPRADPGRYPMAGRANSHVTIGVYDSADHSVRYLDARGVVDDPDVYWTNLEWAVDGSFVLVAIVDRDQDRMRLVKFDASTGAVVRVLFEEHDARWVEPQSPAILHPDASGRFFWFSVRDGHRHLWAFDDEGKVVRQLTKGEFDVVDCIGFSRNLREAFVHVAAPDARQTQLFAVDLGGGGMRRVTTARGTHRCVLAPGGERVLDRRDALDDPGSLDVVDLENGTVATVARAEDPLRAFRRGDDEFFDVTNPEGVVLHGHRILPPGVGGEDGDGDGAVRHPVLWYVYAGPQSQLVTDRWLGGAPAWLHAFAAEGYVVVRVDGRGTDRRGIAFAQAVHRRLVQPAIDDQRAALRVVTSWPFVDPARIGVHGWSFGGTMTLHLLADEPTFRCGVAGAPVVDWERYETGWTERYLDRPEQNPDGYAAADVRAKVARIRQPLLVAFGTADRTVVPSHLDSLVEAAVAAGVGVDVALYPMQRHSLEGAARRHFLLRLRAFLDRELRPGR